MASREIPAGSVRRRPRRPRGLRRPHRRGGHRGEVRLQPRQVAASTGLTTPRPTAASLSCSYTGSRPLLIRSDEAPMARAVAGCGGRVRWSGAVGGCGGGVVMAVCSSGWPRAAGRASSRAASTHRWIRLLRRGCRPPGSTARLRVAGAISPMTAPRSFAFACLRGDRRPCPGRGRAARRAGQNGVSSSCDGSGVGGGGGRGGSSAGRSRIRGSYRRSRCS